MANGTSSTRGGGGGGGTNTAKNPAPPAPAPAPVQKTRGAVQNNMGTFAQLTADQQATAIENALRSSVPVNLNSNSDLQKLLYSQGLTSAPEVVTDAQLKAMKGRTLYRTVNSMYDSSNDIGFTAPQIAQMTMKSGQLYLPNGGKAVYGEGIYFADTLRGSTSYGKTTGDINKTCVMSAKIKAGTKTISTSRAWSDAQKEIKNNTKLGKALKKCSDPASVYALCKGYQTMDNGGGYHVILDRSCLAMSSTINPK